MNKGIIAAPARVLGNGSNFSTQNRLTAQEIRYFLLYWDKIVIPTTNLVHLAIPEEDELLSSGIIERPRVQFSGNFNGELIAKAQVFAQTSIAKDLIANDKITDWALHQIGNEIIIPDEETVKKQTIRVDLNNALPVPDSNVPLIDILEFKERRKDELFELHQTIDNFYLDILSSPDTNLKTKISINELTKAINNLNTVSAEKWKNTKKFDIAAELNLNGKDVTSGAAAGAAFDFFTNLYTLPIGTVVGACASLIKIKLKTTKSFEASKDKQVLSYLAKAHDENLLQ
jgi:hypothetical protein